MFELLCYVWALHPNMAHFTKKNSAKKMVNFKILKIPLVGFFLDPKYIIILNFRQLHAKPAEEMSGNHSVHRRTDGRTDTVNPIYPPTNYVIKIKPQKSHFVYSCKGICEETHN